MRLRSSSHSAKVLDCGDTSAHLGFSGFELWCEAGFQRSMEKGRFVLAHESFQGGNLPCAEDQGQFIRKALFLSNDCLPVFFLFRLVHELDRLPVGHWPSFTIAEHSFEHSARPSQANVPSVQGC